jgi:hypothetical protein
VHTEACRHILLPHAATIPLEQSCLYQAPEILNPEADLDEVGLSSKPSDVYAFACTVLAVRNLIVILTADSNVAISIDLDR